MLITSDISELMTINVQCDVMLMYFALHMLYKARCIPVWSSYVQITNNNENYLLPTHICYQSKHISVILLMMKSAL